MSNQETFDRAGWLVFPQDDRVSHWVEHARGPATAALSDPAFAQWHVCQGTWFVGVDALPNRPDGGVAGSGPLDGAVMSFIAGQIGLVPPLHRAQVSAVWPSYPKPREGESDAGFRYRLKRDAAHVDGIRATGPERRRRIEECHAFILGLPLNRADTGAAPLVVWDGSHEIMRAAFRQALDGTDPAKWGRVDVTQIYQSARREVFETCKRIELHTQPGEAVVLHRLSVHGVAPWQEGASADGGVRMVAYFRPELPGGVADWVNLP